jgi:hypothetical protein
MTTVRPGAQLPKTKVPKVPVTPVTLSENLSENSWLAIDQALPVRK